MPARLDSLKWVLVAGFGALFAAWLGLRVAPASSGGFAGGASGVIPRSSSVSGSPGRIAAARARQSDAATASAERESRSSRQPRRAEGRSLPPRIAPPGGTITEEDYARERDRVRENPARSGERLSITALPAHGTSAPPLCAIAGNQLRRCRKALWFARRAQERLARNRARRIRRAAGREWGREDHAAAHRGAADESHEAAASAFAGGCESACRRQLFAKTSSSAWSRTARCFTTN